MIIRESLATAVDLDATSLQYVALLSEADRRLVAATRSPGWRTSGCCACGCDGVDGAARGAAHPRAGPAPSEEIDAGLAAGVALDLHRSSTRCSPQGASGMIG